MSTPRGMSATPSALQDRGDLARGRRRNRPASGATAPRRPIIPAWMFSPAQPRAVEAVVLGGRAEVPDVRLAAAGQQRVAGHLVARPLADVGAGDVADVVEVEEQQRAEVRRRQGAAWPDRSGRCAAGRRSSAPPSRRSSTRARRRPVAASAGDVVRSGPRPRGSSRRRRSMRRLEFIDATQPARSVTSRDRAGRIDTGVDRARMSTT